MHEGTGVDGLMHEGTGVDGLMGLPYLPVNLSVPIDLHKCDCLSGSLQASGGVAGNPLQ